MPQLKLMTLTSIRKPIGKKLIKRTLGKSAGQGKVKSTLVQLILDQLRPFFNVLREIEARLKLILEILAWWQQLTRQPITLNYHKY